MRTTSFCIVVIGLTLLGTGASTQENKSAAPVGNTVADVDGNVYKTVTIGNQVWMAADLKTTQYRNGDLIGTNSPATLDISSESTPKYQWAYAGDESNVATYGRLYTWFAATDSRNVCPVGWHVPSDAEWQTLIDFLGGDKAAQGKLKEAGTTHWHSPNTDATNESGFTALPGGNRFNNEPFAGLGYGSHWWTTTEYDAKFAWRRIMVNITLSPIDHTGGWADKKIGWHVRCLKDASTLPIASLAAMNSTNTVSPGAPQRQPLDVTYIGNEGFMIQAGGKKVLVDALFDGSTTYLAPAQELLAQMTRGSAPFADVDLLLVTHPHGDHFNAKLVIEFLRHHTHCQLIAHTQVVDLLRKEEGFAQIEKQIHEVKLEPGAYAHVSLNGIDLDALCLKHMADNPDQEQTRNLAFDVELGGARFLHMGDSSIIQNETYLNRYPFERSPVDLLFLNEYDRTHTTQKFIAEKIKPSQIVAMHIPPAELAEETDKILAFYPHAIIFRQSMERRSIPIEVDFHNLTGAYLGQTPPGATPQVFVPGIVSTEANEHSAPSFSPDGNEVFWWANRWPDLGPPMSMTMRRENGLWSAPRVSPFGSMPAFSPDGRRIYYFAPRPGSEAAQNNESNLDIWVAEKQGDGWSEPKCLNLAARYPELRYADMPRVTRNGTLYFLGYAPDTKSNHGIYRAELINGEYTKPELLPRNINLPTFLNSAPFIAPDESYLLFSSNRAGSLDEYGDIYISRRQPDGSWTDPVSLGEPVNTDMQEVFPGLSPDGKYLFFCRYTPGHKNDVYWVDAASIPALRSITAPLQEKTK